VSDRSRIEWTDASWNPVRGCSKITPGCKHCYAETFAERFRGVPGHPNVEQGFDLKLVPNKLPEPLRWSKSRRIFVNSMSDLFHEGVPDDYIAAVARVMVAANWHTFQVLTKRADRLRRLLSGPLRFATIQPHIWWGVSVENRRHGLPRVEELRASPATVRFLSIEPLLEDLGRLDLGGHPLGHRGRREWAQRSPCRSRLGGIYPRAVPSCGSAVLLQAMGWSP
jgi:protein gp37